MFYDILDSHQAYGLSAAIVALVIYSVRVSKTDGFFITLMLYVLFSFLHIQWDAHHHPKFNDLENNPFIWEFWYLGFATLDFLFVSLVVLVKFRLRKNFSHSTSFILSGYLAMGLMQIATYVEGFYPELSGYFFYDIYFFFIPGVNLTLTICIIFTVLLRLKARALREV